MITLCDTPLIGFLGDMVPHQVIHMIVFLIVDHPGAYNIILGRPFLATTKASISMHYLAMKIPTAEEIITIKGNKQLAQGCYFITSKANYQIATNMFLEGYLVSTRPLITLSKWAVARRRQY